MKPVISKDEAKEIKEHSTSTFFEYGLPSTTLAVGVSVINGRYPIEGFDIDEQVEQIWFVKSGIGKINIHGNTHELKEDDVVHVPKGEKFWIEGQNLTLVVSSSPPWFPEQHKHISG